MKEKILLSSVCFLLLLAFSDFEKDKTVVILYTSNINGVLRDCGCGGEKLGGMARLKTLVEDYRTRFQNLYLIDTGDHFSNNFYPEKNILIYELMKELDYDFILQADQDISAGKIVPQVQLFYEQNKQLFNYSIPKKVYGFLPDSLDRINGKRQFVNNSPFLIFHADSSEFVQRRNNFKKKKFIFLSHSQDLKFSKIGSHILFQSGMDTEYLGVAFFQKDGDHYQFEKNSFIRLDSTIREDQDFKSRIDRYFLDIEHSLDPYYSESAEKQVYLGVDNCKQCHPVEFNKWKESNHSHAFAKLKQENRAFDPECLSCHTSGYKRGGYRSYLETKFLTDVQCESCHQNLAINHQWAKQKLLYQKVTEATCLNCHTKKNSPDFDYSLYLSKITHWRKQ